MTLTIIFALPLEFAPWRSRHRFLPITGETGGSAHEARFGSNTVRVRISGIGAPDARALVATAARVDRADAIVIAGLAGGLKPRYAAGQVLSPAAVRSEGAMESVLADESLIDAATRCGATVVDTLVSTNRIVARADEKLRLGRHDDAVDMESFAVMAEARSLRIPAVAIRVVGDAANVDIPLDVSRAIGPNGTIRTSRVLRDIVASPTRWPAIVRFGLAQGRALAELASFLDRFVVSIRCVRAS